MRELCKQRSNPKSFYSLVEPGNPGMVVYYVKTDVSSSHKRWSIFVSSIRSTCLADFRPIRSPSIQADFRQD